MKAALVAFGNEESYGLLFVGRRLLDLGQEIKFFDAEEGGVLLKIKRWHPDFLMLSPMTTFYPRALELARHVKAHLSNVVTVFGGHHAMAKPSIIEDSGVDVVAVGPAYGSVEKIIDGQVGVIKVSPTTPVDLGLPARKEYYRDVPRMAIRYRKVMLSKLGCPWNCSYCSSACSHIRSIFGAEAHGRYYLTRRPLHDIMEEGRIVAEYDTKEVEWVDDDMLSGSDVDKWIPEFVDGWRRHVGLPMYVSTTSVSALRVSDKTLRRLRYFVNVVGMGVQAIRPDSLRMFNRAWDNEGKMKAAYDRLRSFGFSVNLQAIIGLPIEDPVEDAIDTIKGLQRVGAGSVCSIYPLMVYPNTKMELICRDFPLRKSCSGDTNSALTAIHFSPIVTKQLRNICKLGTLFVKFNIDENWIRALINVDFDDSTSKDLSIVRYHDCVVDRLKEEGESVFRRVLSTTNVRY